MLTKKNNMNGKTTPNLPTLMDRYEQILHYHVLR